MFDARSILDAIVAGSSEQTRNARESGGLKDIMGDLLGQLQKGGGQASQFDRDDQRGSQGQARNPLEDLFGQITGGAARQQQTEQRSDDRYANDDSYGRDDGRTQRQADPRHQDYAGDQGGYGDILDRVKDLVGKNKTAAGAIVGGLGGLLLGTKAGRSLTGRAVRLGGLALIGTLAYKALTNFQQGGSPSQGGQDDDRFGVPELPPQGSGFEEQAMSNDDAALFIRTMVAAAASDGQIDREEQQAILGNLREAGLEDEAMEFLAKEFNSPASVDDIIVDVRSKEQAVKVYTAARIAIEPDTRDEQQFLAYLGERLGIDRDLAAHIDATASGIKVS